jgi:hypothetical protein
MNTSDRSDKSDPPDPHKIRTAPAEVAGNVLLCLANQAGSKPPAPSDTSDKSDKSEKSDPSARRGPTSWTSNPTPLTLTCGP